MQENLLKTLILENRDLINKQEWSQVFSRLLDFQSKWEFLQLVLNQISSFPGIGLDRQDLAVLGELITTDFENHINAINISDLIDTAELDSTNLFEIIKFAKLLSYFVFKDTETDSYYIAETLGGMIRFAKSNNIPLINLTEQ